jgi:hypothetical protein
VFFENDERQLLQGETKKHLEDISSSKSAVRLSSLFPSPEIAIYVCGHKFISNN